MTDTATVNQRSLRIGIMIAPLAKRYNDTALRYLILRMNTEQDSFEYALLPSNGLAFMEKLSYDKTVDRTMIEKEVGGQLARNIEQDSIRCSGYGINLETVDHTIILSTAKFSDNYYISQNADWTIAALGHWKEDMAPPSIIEFFLSMIVRTSIDVACGNEPPKRHYGSKGCCFDFASEIENTRYFVLTGYLCKACTKTVLEGAGSEAANAATTLLKRKWLGTASEPSDSSLTARKLGQELFKTKGIAPTTRERIKAILTEEATKAVLKVLVLIAGTALLIYLGLKK